MESVHSQSPSLAAPSSVLPWAAAPSSVLPWAAPSSVLNPRPPLPSILAIFRSWVVLPGVGRGLQAAGPSVLPRPPSHASWLRAGGRAGARAPRWHVCPPETLLCPPRGEGPPHPRLPSWLLPEGLGLCTSGSGHRTRRPIWRCSGLWVCLRQNEAPSSGTTPYTPASLLVPLPSPRGAPCELRAEGPGGLCLAATMLVPNPVGLGSCGAGWDEQPARGRPGPGSGGGLHSEARSRAGAPPSESLSLKAAALPQSHLTPPK